jgi:membrane protein YdbS with pleckstrin-like domain
MTNPTPKPRWFYPTPSWLIVALLVVEGLLWLSERFQWFDFHKGYAVLIAVVAVGATILVMLFWFLVSVVIHRRFRFSIWSLLLLTVAIAIACGWLWWERELARRQRELSPVFPSVDTLTVGPSLIGE